MAESKLCLNKQALDDILIKRRLSYSDLARLIGWSSQNLHYHLKNRTVKAAEQCSTALRISLRDLLVINR
jgi:hypothetical protein